MPQCMRITPSKDKSMLQLKGKDVRHQSKDNSMLKLRGKDFWNRHQSKDNSMHAAAEAKTSGTDTRAKTTASCSN